MAHMLPNQAAFPTHAGILGSRLWVAQQIETCKITSQDQEIQEAFIMTKRPATLIGACLAAAFVLALAGCSEPAPEADTPTAAPTAANDRSGVHEYGYQQSITEEAGQAVYEEVCADCHDGGDFRAPHKSMVRLMSAQSIYKALTQGAMQLQGADLADEDKIRVAEYLADQRIGDITNVPEPAMCTGEAAEFDMNEPPVFPGWGLTRGNARYVDSSKTTLTRDNVKNLKLKWSFAFPEALRVRSQPALAGGALIVGSHNGKVYALDRESACVRWTFNASADVRNGIVVSPWEAGDKNAQPLAFFGDLLGYVYAVDARNGELIWRDRPDTHPNATMTGAPTLYNDTLYVPVSSLEVITTRNPEYECCTFRGSVVAYEARTGTKKWQTYSVADEPSPLGVTSVGTTRLGPSGAPIWNSPAVDEHRGQIVFGTGENYSSPATGTSDAIIAVDMETGNVNWVFQGTAGDAWNGACSSLGGDHNGPNCPEEDGPDVDFGAGATFNTTSDGRDLVIAGQKSGSVFAINPDNGELVWKQKAGRGSLLGGINFGISVSNDKVYVPIADVIDGSDFPGDRHPGMHALDINTGEFIWRSPMEDTCNGRKFCVPGIAVATTSSDELVFAGGIDGIMRIYDADTGEVLWSFQTAKDFVDVNGATGNGGAISGGAAAVPYGNTLYVSSGYAFNGLMPGNMLFAFEVE
jgi:polyvinyl alcohol dehydrogenase (cytochrome)